MIKTTVNIEGMMCGMCEKHVNEAIVNNFNVKKIKVSSKKNIAEIFSEAPLDTSLLKKTVEDCGYKFISSSCENK